MVNIGRQAIDKAVVRGNSLFSKKRRSNSNSSVIVVSGPVSSNLLSQSDNSSISHTEVPKISRKDTTIKKLKYFNNSFHVVERTDSNRHRGLINPATPILNTNIQPNSSTDSFVITKKFKSYIKDRLRYISSYQRPITTPHIPISDAVSATSSCISNLSTRTNFSFSLIKQPTKGVITRFALSVDSFQE